MDTRSGEIIDLPESSAHKKLRDRFRDAGIEDQDIPFVKPMDLHPTPIQRLTRKVQRNDPCPCGSQKKFKRCCWGKIP